MERAFTFLVAAGEPVPGTATTMERLAARHRSRPPLGAGRCAYRARGETVTAAAIETSRALWNRSGLNLESDEVLAQLLDRGEIASWRALYHMARTDARLRARIKRIAVTVPLPLPRFWLAALASLGEPVDLGVALPDYCEQTSVGQADQRNPAARK